MSVFYPDLLWLVQKKDLLSLQHNQSDLLAPDQTWLDAISHKDLDAFMQSKNTYMLGPYYEALWAFYLMHHPQTKLIAQNIQINDTLIPKTPTIGEMDFIYCDEANDIFVHLEVAIKFYLEVNQIESTQPLSKWVGPKKNDRLDIKYNKLMNHQTKLLNLACTQSIIEPFIKSNRIKPSAVLQGRLFKRFDETVELNKQNTWFTLAEFNSWYAHNRSGYSIQSIVKPHWLSMQHYQDTHEYPVLSLAEIIEKVDSQNDALPFVLTCEFQEKNDLNQPIKRMIFIAPNNWL